MAAASGLKGHNMLFKFCFVLLMEEKRLAELNLMALKWKRTIGNSKKLLNLWRLTLSICYATFE